MRVVTSTNEVIELGEVETAPTIGIIDYSRRVTDDFGVTTVVERGFARRMSVRLKVAFDEVDALQRRLADLRAASALWIADDRFASLSVNGFYKDFEVDLAVPPISFCTLTVEGLTASEAFTDPGGDPAPAGQPSTLQLLQPVTVTDAILASSNVAEGDYAEWSAGTTYPLGARVIKAATHRIYESAIGDNTGADPAGASGKWLDVGPTNRWAMFDQALGTATTGSSQIVLTLTFPSPISAIAMLDLSALTARVQAAGYDRVQYDVGSTATFADLPAGCTSVTIEITASASGAPVSIGTLLAGTIVSLGVTEASPTAGITDYSRKDVDDFGEVTVVQRAWAKRMTAKALIRTDAIDAVGARIAAVRARPSLWIGQAGLDSLTIYGFFKDFSIEVGEAVSKLSLTIEGLSKAAPVPRAQIVLVPRGPYDPALSYGEGDVVEFEGSSWEYDNVVATAGNAPPTLPTTENAYWRVFARAGADGQVGSGSWTHIANSATTIVTPTSARGTASTGWGADGSQSKESYARGAAVDFVLPPAVGRNVMAGLTTHPTSSLSYDRISFAIFRNEVGDMDIRVDGNGYSAVSAPPADQPVACRVEFDGVDTVRWYVAGSLRTTMAWPYPDIPLFFACALASNDPRVESIAFSSIGARGLNGHNAISALLTNEAHTVPADVAGNVTSYTGANTIMRVYDGGFDVTDIGLFALSIVSNPQILSISVDGRSFGVYGGFDASEDTAAIVARVTGSGQYAGVIIDKTFSLAKSKAGEDGNSPSITTLTASTQLARYDTNGGFIPGQSIRFIAQKQNSGSAITVWRVRNCDDAVLSQLNGGAAFAGALGYGSYAESDDVVVMSGAAVEAYITVHGGSPGRFSVGAVAFGWVNWDDVSVQKVQDGARGADGKGALSAYLTNENFSYPVDANGAPNAVPNGVGNGSMRVFYGLTEVTAQCTFTVQLPFWLSATVDASGNYSGYDLGSDNGFAYIIATYQGQVIALTLTATKSRQGGPGISAKTLYITSSAQTLSVNAGDALEPAGQAITFTAVKQNTGAAVYWQIFDGYGGVHSVATHSTGGVDYGDSITLPGSNMLAIINYPQSVGQGVYKTLRVVGTLTDGVVISDTISVVKVAAGANGTPGTSPYLATLSTQQLVVPASSTGTTKPGSLPKTMALLVKQGATNVTGSASVTTIANPSNLIAMSYSGGVLSLTQADGDGYVDVRVAVGGTTVDTIRVSVRRELDTPPAGVTSSFETFVSTTTYDARVSPIMTVAADANGQIVGEMFSSYDVSAPNGNYNVTLAAKLQYRPANTSGAIDMAAEKVGTQALKSGTGTGGGTSPDDPPPNEPVPGAVSFTATVGGLVVGANYEVWGLLRRYSGNASANSSSTITARKP